MRRKIWSDRDVENGLPVKSGTAGDDPVQALLAQIEASLPYGGEGSGGGGTCGIGVPPWFLAHRGNGAPVG